MTPTSGEADGMRLIRSISLRARDLTSSGMPAASTFSRSSFTSACCGSSSPSSRWMAFSCSRRMYSRWVLSISDLTSDWILPFSSRISIWLDRKALTSLRRSTTSIVSRSSWRCSVVMSGLYATMSARSPGSLMLRAATAASGGTGAPLATYCSIWAWTVRMRAWTSTPASGSAPSVATRAKMNGSDCSKSTTRRRCGRALGSGVRLSVRDRDVFAVEGVEDGPAELVLDHEEDLDAGEVDVAVAGEVGDAEDARDVVHGRRPDVGASARGSEEALL